MAFALLGVSLIASSYAFLNKIALNRGLSSKMYLLATSLGIAILSPFLFVFLPYKMIWNVYSVLLLFVAGFFIIVKVLFTSKALEKVTPLEASAFATLAVVVTFVLDIVFKINSFNVYAMLSLFVVLMGCAVISKGGKHIKEVKLFILFLILGQLGQGYGSYFAMKHFMSPAAFLFFVFLGIAFVMLLFYKKFGPITKNALLFGIAVQSIGIVNAVLEVVLVRGSATYFMLRIPAIMVVTILLTFLLKKDVGEKPERVQLYGALVVLVGLVLYTLTQI